MSRCRIGKEISPTLHSAICSNPWFSCCFDINEIRKVLSRSHDIEKSHILMFNIITQLTQMSASDIDRICNSIYGGEKPHFCLIGTWNLPAPYTFGQCFINLISNCFKVAIINYGLPAHHRRALTLQKLLKRPVILISRHHAKYIISINQNNMNICCLYAGSANLTDSGLESSIEVFYVPSQCNCIGLINELHKVYRESLYDNISIDELRDHLEEVIKLLEQLLRRGGEILPDGGLGDKDFWYFYDLWKASHSVEESLVRLVRIVSCHCFKNVPREVLYFLDLLSTLWKIVHKLSNISLQAKHVALSKLIYGSESESIAKCLDKYRRRVSYLIKNISPLLDKLYYYRSRIDTILGLLKDSVNVENERRFREWLDEFLDVTKG